MKLSDLPIYDVRIEAGSKFKLSKAKERAQRLKAISLIIRIINEAV